MRIAREKLERLQTDLRDRVEHEQQDAEIQLVLGRKRPSRNLAGCILAPSPPPDGPIALA
jgi:hypothetical protein